MGGDFPLPGGAYGEYTLLHGTIGARGDPVLEAGREVTAQTPSATVPSMAVRTQDVVAGAPAGPALLVRRDSIKVSTTRSLFNPWPTRFWIFNPQVFTFRHFPVAGRTRRLDARCNRVHTCSDRQLRHSCGSVLIFWYLRIVQIIRNLSMVWWDLI